MIQHRIVQPEAGDWWGFSFHEFVLTVFLFPHPLNQRSYLLGKAVFAHRLHSFYQLFFYLWGEGKASVC